jgi:hypothetical protein
LTTTATTFTIGYTSTASSTTNISTGAAASGSTKTINIGTGGAAGSTTNINIGDADGGSTKILTPSAIVPGNLSVGQDIIATTGPILTLGTLVSGGTGYMNGTHANQALTGGTGLYMLATVTVALGVVTGITLTWGGHRYSVNDTLTVGSLTTTLATTAASGTGTTATLTFAAQPAAPFQVGSQIIVAGVTPAGYNGTFTVTACTTTTVSYANTTTGAQTVAGTVKMGTPLTNSTIPVATVQGSDVYVSSYTSDSIGSRIRLEANDTTVAAGQELGAILFSSRDGSTNASGDVGIIRGIAAGVASGSEIEFWTGASGTAPTRSAVVTSGGNFRLYNSAGTFYTELSNSPTANRTVTVPDVAGTMSIIQSAAAGYFDTSTTTPTGTTRLNYGGYFYPTFINLSGSSDTATAATHYFVETGSDGFVRPKTLANVKSELLGNQFVAFSGPTAARTFTLPDSSQTLATLGNAETFSANKTFSGNIISTHAWDAANGGGEIYLNGTTGNRIEWNTSGVAAPAFTTRSAGTKLLLFPNIGAAAVDYAIGMASGTLWNSVPTSSQQFAWYAGTTAIATLSGAAEFLTTSVAASVVEAGRTSGSVALTVNDGYGNANVTFNHKNGVPDITGSSARIVSPVDGATASMTFQLGSSTTSGVAVGLTTYFGIYTTGVTVTGNATATGEITAYSSDIRLKEDIIPIPDAVDKVSKLSGVFYKWRAESVDLGLPVDPSKREVGLLAQEVEAILPEAVAPAPFDIELDEFNNPSSKSGENYLTVKYERLVPLLIEAVKEQQATINSLTQRIRDLEESITGGK